MVEDSTVLEGAVQWMEVEVEDGGAVGLAVLIDEQDLLGILSELEGRRVRVTIELLEDDEG